MWRLRTRLVAEHRWLPRTGYGLAVFVCLGLAQGTGGRISWEVAWFIAFPALLGLAHFVAPRDRRGGKAYWVLAGTWLGAAAVGALSHWTALDPITPWLSLSRYALVVVGGTLAGVSKVLGRPEFAAAPEPREGKVWARAGGGLLLLEFIALVSFVLAHTPFRLALAPRYPGARVTTLFTAPKDTIPMWLAWSPDSRRLLMQVGEEIWVLRPGQNAITRTEARGSLSSDRPWLRSGAGFFFSRREGGRNSAWLASPDGKPLGRIIPHASGVTCSPDGRTIAFSGGRDIWLARTDGSGQRLLAKDAGWPAWSPDGRHVLFLRRDARHGRVGTIILGVSSLDGRARALPSVNALPWKITWLGPDSLAVAPEVGPRTSSRRFFLGERVAVDRWMLTGATRELIGYRSMWPEAPELATSTDGRRLALAGGAISTLVLDALMLDRRRSHRGGIYVLDLPTHRVRRAPGADLVWEMAWSPDGKSLAFVGTDLQLPPKRGSESASTWVVGVVSGL